MICTLIIIWVQNQGLLYRQTACRIVRFYLYSKKKTQEVHSLFSNINQRALVVWNSPKNQETPNKQGHNSEVKPETSFKKLVQQCSMNDPDQSTVSTADCDGKQGIQGHTEVRKALSQLPTCWDLGYHPSKQLFPPIALPLCGKNQNKIRESKLDVAFLEHTALWIF